MRGFPPLCPFGPFPLFDLPCSVIPPEFQFRKQTLKSGLGEFSPALLHIDQIAYKANLDTLTSTMISGKCNNKFINLHVPTLEI